MCAVITFWAQCTGSFLFNLYPYAEDIWTDSMNEIIHISAKIALSSQTQRWTDIPFYRRNYSFYKIYHLCIRVIQRGRHNTILSCNGALNYRQKHRQSNGIFLSCRRMLFYPKEDRRKTNLLNNKCVCISKYVGTFLL